MDSSVVFVSSHTGNRELGRVPWAELSADTLVEVFKRLPVKDRLAIIPQICKAWKKASLDPGCWQAVDLKEWCRDNVPGNIDRMVRLVVERSCGGIQELRLARLQGDASLQFLTQSGLSSLKTLCIPASDITENGFCELVLSLPSLVHLDISQCGAISSTGLEVIGRTCTSLRRLDRVMWPMRAWPFVLDDSEAMAVAKNMPKLKHLKMSSDWVSDSSFSVIRDSCPDLEVLEIESVNYDEDDVDYLHDDLEPDLFLYGGELAEYLEAW